MTVEVPDFMKAAMKAQGKVDPDEIAEAAAAIDLDAHEEQPAVEQPTLEEAVEPGFEFTQESMDDLPGEAHARRGDPGTSHAAAASIPPEMLRASQAAVRACFAKHGEMNHEELISVYGLTYVDEGWPKQSESGLRTRCAELVDAEYLRDTGRTVKLPSGRLSIVWAVNVP